VEQQLAHTPWLAGAQFTLADINFFCHCGMMVQRMFPEMKVETRAPRLVDWAQRMRARPGVQAALAMPDKTNPALRTFTGHVR
jgi:glutathione S-transferase